jgi:hypothetical protein
LRLGSESISGKISASKEVKNMSDKTTGEATECSGRGSGEDATRLPYEAPKLTRLGNARELLAGNAGSVMDMGGNPRLPNQPGP